MFKNFRKGGLGYGLMYKSNRDGEDLENSRLGDGTMTHNILLTRLHGGGRRKID